jgi:hypothetical protein
MLTLREHASFGCHYLQEAFMSTILSQVAFATVLLSLAASAFGAESDYIRVEVRGTIETGIVAIGGETTGVTITAGKTTLELEIKDPKLQALAEKLNGKKAVAKGTLEIRPGVEVKERRIVAVTGLQAGGQ